MAKDKRKQEIWEERKRPTMTAQSIENNLDVAGRDYISGYASTIFQRVSR
jgi:hypothetical protein